VADVTLTSVCTCPQPDKLLLPQHSDPVGQVLVKTPSGKSAIVQTDIRSDPGEGACVQGALLAKLGGHGATISYKKAGPIAVLRYKRSIWLQGAIALLSFFGTLISGWAAFLKSSADPSNSFTYETATALLLITFVLATLKLYKDAASPQGA
jgi:hypothetical protein